MRVGDPRINIRAGFRFRGLGGYHPNNSGEANKNGNNEHYTGVYNIGCAMFSLGVGHLYRAYPK